jgi:hypothetical protein
LIGWLTGWLAGWSATSVSDSSLRGRIKIHCLCRTVLFYGLFAGVQKLSPVVFPALWPVFRLAQDGDRARTAERRWLSYFAL